MAMLQERNGTKRCDSNNNMFENSPTFWITIKQIFDIMTKSKTVRRLVK